MSSRTACHLPGCKGFLLKLNDGHSLGCAKQVVAFSWNLVTPLDQPTVPWLNLRFRQCQLWPWLPPPLMPCHQVARLTWSWPSGIRQITKTDRFEFEALLVFAPLQLYKCCNLQDAKVTNSYLPKLTMPSADVNPGSYLRISINQRLEDQVLRVHSTWFNPHDFEWKNWWSSLTKMNPRDCITKQL